MNPEEKNSMRNYLQKQTTELPLILDEEISYHDRPFNHRNDFKDMTKLIDDFLNGDNINRFIVLPGLRGVGKTTILYHIYEYLLKTKNITQNQILFVSCDQINKITKCDILETIEYYLDEFHHLTPRTMEKELFLLIDESHFDKEWSMAGKIIYDQSKKIFMIFTGSSALKLEYENEAKRRMLRNSIFPLNYSQHLKLKYDYDAGNISNELFHLLFTSEIDKSCELEQKINIDLMGLKNYTVNDWDKYFKFGGFPSVMHEKTERKACEKLYESVDAIVTKDLGTIKNITTDTQDQALRLLQFLAQKFPGDISQATLAQSANTNKSAVNSLLRLLEKTQLIFHYEPYVSPGGRVKKSWNYYFANSSIRHAINFHFGFSSMKKEDYEGILVENLVASALFNAMNNENYFKFDVFFDYGKNNVDFLIKKGFENPIPIEVGLGTKTKRQITKAINKYNSNHGIIISNTTRSITMDDNIIYIPIKTFSLL